MTTPAYLLEIESNILGTYMECSSLFDECEHLVSSNIFIRPSSKASFTIIKQLHSKGVKPDYSLIYSSLKDMGFPNTECAVNYSFNYKYQSDIKEYVDILFKQSVATYLLPIIQDTHQKLSSNGDPIELMGGLSDSINKVNLVLNNVSKTKDIHTIFDEAVQRIKDASVSEVEYMGYSWGIKELDKKTGGIIQGTNTVAALPGAGKTTLIINIIRANTIDKDIPMLVFSIEMPAVELMTNLIANITEINSRALRQGDVDAGNWLSIESVKSRLKKNLEIDDTGGITWQYFESRVKAFRRKHNIPLTKTILVAKDYLQIMGSSAEEKKLGREERIEIICNEQTRICKNENVALVDLSQFSREAGRRFENKAENPRPKMTDLKGSGAIEANSVLILLMFRPEYHGIFNDNTGIDLRGLVEINIAKGRYVNPEPIYARFIGKYSKFGDYTPQQEQSF